MNTTVDVENGTATADVSSFSYFTVMVETAWEERITATVHRGWPQYESFQDLSGWDVDGDATVRNGTLVLSRSGGTALDPDVVVSKDGNGDFGRIQPAVDAAGAGESVLVRGGTYSEEVVVDAPVRLVGRGAVLDGSPLGESSTGIRLQAGVEADVEGFTIRNYEVGIGDGGADDVRIADSRFVENKWGVNLVDSTGR